MLHPKTVAARSRDTTLRALTTRVLAGAPGDGSGDEWRRSQEDSGYRLHFLILTNARRSGSSAECFGVDPLLWGVEADLVPSDTRWRAPSADALTAETCPEDQENPNCERFPIWIRRKLAPDCRGNYSF